MIKNKMINYFGCNYKKQKSYPVIESKFYPSRDFY